MFVIGLIVRSDAPVFVGGETVKEVASSPFVLGRLTSRRRDVLRPNIVHSSSCRNVAHPELGPCDQCVNAHIHCLSGGLGVVHCITNLVRVSTPEASPKRLQKSDKARSSCLGATFLLALQLPRVLEFGRGTTRWYGGHDLPLVQC